LYLYLRRRIHCGALSFHCFLLGLLNWHFICIVFVYVFVFVFEEKNPFWCTQFTLFPFRPFELTFYLYLYLYMYLFCIWGEESILVHSVFTVSFSAFWIDTLFVFVFVYVFVFVFEEKNLFWCTQFTLFPFRPFEWSSIKGFHLHTSRIRFLYLSLFLFSFPVKKYFCLCVVKMISFCCSI